MAADLAAYYIFRLSLEGKNTLKGGAGPRHRIIVSGSFGGGLNRNIVCPSWHFADIIFHL
jgi:hypothetical protein